MEVEKIKQKTVVDQVMKKIKELIASGRFKTNDKIPTENELAEIFGIGRSSVREAIKIFQYLGVLETRTRNGTFVCDRANISTEALTWSILLSQNETFEIVALRDVIEQRSIVILTENYKKNPDQFKNSIEILEREIINMEEAVSNSSVEELITADYNFHGTIIRASNNSLFFSIYQTLKAFMNEEIKKTYLDIENQNEVIKEHKEILEAIKTGDSQKAHKRMQAHIAGIKRMLTHVM